MEKALVSLIIMVSSLGSASLVRADCNQRGEFRPRPGWVSSTVLCEAGDSTATLEWGYELDADDRKYVQAECSYGDCGGYAGIAGYDAANNLVCLAEWFSPARVYCPASTTHVHFAAVGNFE
jgi:hypothetical protein